ncbi:MAG: NUDIX hydrolase [Comamonadaceae bacterium]|nr:MAG: NUDIX hydrolase [Comamonadaceae bacterium]
MEKIRNPAKLAFERPLATVDLVIFTVSDDSLKVLLVRRPSATQDAGEPFPGRWALPGGFVDVARDASLEACAARKLKEKTGLSTPYLEQLGSWGDAARDPRGWSATHAYFALVHAPLETQEMQKAQEAHHVHDVQDVLEGLAAPIADAQTSSLQWIELESAGKKRLAFDHGKILAAAVDRLRSKVEYTSLPAYLLAEPFTLPQLQQAYEVVLARPVDKSAFRKRMLDAGFLAEAGQVDGGAGRLAMGYRITDRATPATFPRTFKPRE